MSDRRFGRDSVYSSRGRSPNGVAWRFPDWTAVGFRLIAPALITPARLFPDPFLGSPALGHPLPSAAGGAGSDDPLVGGLSPRGAVSPLAATLTRPADGRFGAHSPGWPRRWPPAPAVPAIDCFARPSHEEPDSVTGAFSNSAGRFHVRRRREIYGVRVENPRDFDTRELSYPPAVASD